MKDLKNIRGEIDSIDQEMARLYRRRLEIVGEVAQSKLERGVPVWDPARERDILSRVTSEVGPEFENGARLFFSTLFGITKARQRTILNGEAQLVKDIRDAASGAGRFPNRAVVACPGTEGAYAQQAVTRFFQLPTILDSLLKTLFVILYSAFTIFCAILQIFSYSLVFCEFAPYDSLIPE